MHSQQPDSASHRTEGRPTVHEPLSVPAPAPEHGAATAPLVHETQVESKDAAKEVELAPSSHLKLRLLFDRYEPLGPPIGGGMGLVFKVRDTVLGRIVALKTMKSALLAQPPEVERFLREARAVAQLEHPNIIKLHEYGEHRGEPYFTMEYLEGGSLTSRLAEYTKKDPCALAALMEKVARAVGFAHSKDVIHRDLKPGNILLDQAGEPRVSDFGLAKFLKEGDDITRADQVLGTWYYMSPEQTTGNRDTLSPASDVWSLGVIFYELLTGKKPFNGDTKEKISKEICKKEPVPPSRYRKDFDRKLEHIVAHCLTKDTDQRYRDATELAEALNRWLHGRAVAPPARSPFVPSRKKWKTRALALALLFSTLVLVLLPRLRVRDADPVERDKLLELTERLEKGEEVDLLGDDGRPIYSLDLGDVTRTKVTVSPKDGYEVLTNSLFMRELFPAHKYDSYRLSAEIQHYASFPLGMAGLFFGYHEQSPLGVKVNLFLATGVNDFNDEITPRISFLHASTSYAWDEIGTHKFQDVWLPINDDKARAWRLLVVEARKDSFEVSLDGNKFGSNSFENVNKLALSSLKRNIDLEARDAAQGKLRHHPKLIDLQGFVPQFSARCPLGLYLVRGSAVFRRVRLQLIGLEKH